MKKTIFGRICSFAKVLTIFQNCIKRPKCWFFPPIFKVMSPYTDFSQYITTKLLIQVCYLPIMKQDTHSYPKRYSIKTLHRWEFLLGYFMDYQAERQEGSYHLIMTLSLGISKLLEAFYEACSMSKTVLDKVVAPMLEAHIVETLFLQKQTMAQEGEC